MRRHRRLAAAIVVLLALGLADAFWLEPRVLLLRTGLRIDLPAPLLRAVHLSDLHVVDDRPLLHRLVDEVRAARPDVILLSGDLIKDVPEPEPLARHLAATAAVVSALRRIAPVIAVQGHSEHQGSVIARLDEAGVQWLSNEGRRIGRGGGILLLGVNQQAGTDQLGQRWPKPFRPFSEQGQWFYGAQRDEPFWNFYSHWDPAPAGLADEGGPLAWSGTDVVCNVRIDNSDVGAGLTVHSRFVIGEDRMYRLRRVRAEHGEPGSFVLVAHGTTLSGDVDTGVEPAPGRWYRIRLRTEVEPGVVRLLARVWPADDPEPRDWQARAEDRSRFRVEAGTVGLWGWGGGTVLYRSLQVRDAGGAVLLDAPLTGQGQSPDQPPGWRQGTRGTRLEMALARSPYVPPGTPRVVLSHTPDIALEASRHGLEAVLAGHTHGGQVRLPFLGALTTRDRLGPYYDFGRFEFPAPNARGTMPLYINPGVGTSVLPVRFWCPPRWAVVELGR